MCTPPGCPNRRLELPGGSKPRGIAASRCETRRRRWQGMAAAHELAGRVRFLGFRTDVPDLLRAADVLIAPSRYEPYGLTVHEALCCGLPALVSAAAGVAERYPAELSDLLIPNVE